MSAIGRVMTAGMSSSLRQDWATPSAIFDFLNREFRFSVDICADASNAKCPVFITEEMNAFSRDWSAWPVIWMNPPYGRGIGKWIQRAFRASEAGSTVVCLIPARTDTSWWHDFCMRGEVRFLRGRLRFDDSNAGRCPFPSAIVIFRPLGVA